MWFRMRRIVDSRNETVGEKNTKIKLGKFSKIDDVLEDTRQISRGHETFIPIVFCSLTSTNKENVFANRSVLVKSKQNFP